MILLVRLADGTEEMFSVSEHTKLATLLKHDYWTFSTLEGGQIAIHRESVDRVELGNVNSEDQELLQGRDDKAV